MAIVNTLSFNASGFQRGHFVYFLVCDDGECVLIKVGISESPLKRAKNLATGCPFPLQYVGFSEIGTEKGARYVEGLIHAALSEWRTQGEWFRFPVDENQLFRDRVLPILAAHRKRKRSTDPVIEQVNFSEYVNAGREFRKRFVRKEIDTSVELQIAAARR